ncbi:FAD-dependent thymidylate synthase [Alteromonas sp.]|uniref:FAD-dependent thymidylate synthase n=1 Tax=Alteromonas sp. TaxID=232 RepID=UPI000B697E1B|nr:FAD-dependent thymidylate synthase [Alteromonas sp.]MAI39418.1 thymidylate synthase (FAD) [Alteromonas sp.]
MSKVSLVALSKPSATTDCSTASELVAYTARVSNPGNQNNKKTAPKLLSYLMREDHWSPFEMVHMTMEIKTTRDIARQILRHRSFSFQEFSQRYAEATEWEKREARLQDPKNRQNSVETEDRLLQESWNMQQATVIRAAKEAYNWALERGIAKEQARAVLPEGNTMSTLYMAGSLRSWIHYCDLRRGNGTQKEHMLVADQCWEIIGQHFPDIVKALEE